nr:tRNA(His) guanylyltransferase 1-like isoform X1 [Tanacetum cinerariifolium]
MANSNKTKSKKNTAKSKYEYVKDFETKDPLEPGQFIVVRVHCSNFARFSQVNEFEKPNDEKAQNLMNSCAVSMCQELPHIILAYGFGSEYSFIFRKETDHYKRRASKLLSVIASLFTSAYRMKWAEFFQNKDMRSGASFEAEVLCLKRTSDIQAYLAFKQEECYENNDLPNMFRLGSCILKTLVDNRRKIIVVHAENIASRAFLNSHSILFKELTGLDENAVSIGEKQLNIWREKNGMKKDHWIVVRINRCCSSR